MPEGVIISGIIGGFISKIINDCVDISKYKIKKADQNRKEKNQNSETRIYQIIVEALNVATNNKYKNKDIIYDAAENLLTGLQRRGVYDKDVINSALCILEIDNVNYIRQKFVAALYKEICSTKNIVLYREICLLLLNQERRYSHDMFEYIRKKLDEINQGMEKQEQKRISNQTQNYAKRWEDSNMFLNNPSDGDGESCVAIKLKDVLIEDHLPHYKLKASKPKDDLNVFLSKYIYKTNDTKNMLLVLGQPGIGKSTLITWITAYYNSRINDILVYTFTDYLKNIDWQTSDISDKILEKLGLSTDQLKGKTLILDGFDEVSIEGSRENILNSLYDELIYEKAARNKFSLIITCRENYIHEFEKLRCDYIVLQPWDEKQICSFCDTFERVSQSNISEDTKNNLIQNEDIFGIPLILYMVLALNITIAKEESIVEVYDKIFSLDGGIYDRCIDNKNFAGKHRISDMKRYIHQISKDIAMWIFENKPNEAYIPQTEYQEICNKVKQECDKKNIARDAIIGNFFKLQHCEGEEAETICFVHRSIYEYFVTETIFSSINEMMESAESLAGAMGKLLKGNCISKLMLQFLEIKIKKSKLADKFSIIFNAFKIMLRDGMTYYTKECYKNVIQCELNVFSNMLQIIHLWMIDNLKLGKDVYYYIKYSNRKELNLSKLDLSWITLDKVYLGHADLSDAKLFNAHLNVVDLSEADLTGAVLEEVQLVNANLTGADLSKANLIRADLRGADLKEADLKGADLKEADLRGADLRRANLIMPKLRGANLKEACLDEKQISYLKQSYDLKDTRVYITETGEIISYDEYRKRKH